MVKSPTGRGMTASSAAILATSVISWADLIRSAACSKTLRLATSLLDSIQVWARALAAFRKRSESDAAARTATRQSASSATCSSSSPKAVKSVAFGADPYRPAESQTPSAAL